MSLDCRTCGACCTNPDENRQEGSVDWVEIEPGELILRRRAAARLVVYNAAGVAHLRLDVVDHPAGVFVYPDERFATSDPQPSQELLRFRDRRFPKKATDQRGSDGVEVPTNLRCHPSQEGQPAKEEVCLRRQRQVEARPDADSGVDENFDDEPQAIRRAGFRVVRQILSGASRQLDGLPVDGDDGLFIRVVAEPQPYLPWLRQDAPSASAGLCSDRSAMVRSS